MPVEPFLQFGARRCMYVHRMLWSNPRQPENSNVIAVVPWGNKRVLFASRIHADELPDTANNIRKGSVRRQWEQAH